MTFKQYQQLANRTSGTHVEGTKGILCSVLGLCGESGEVADHFKKVIAHGHPFDVDKIKKELGDCLWYVADICKRENWDMEEIAEMNITKLEKRYPNGFSSERSLNKEKYDETV